VLVQKGIFDIKENYSIVPSSVVFAYALAVVTAGNASRVLLAGIDGFSENDPRQVEMENILSLYQSTSNRVPLISVTPTNYLLNTTSIYAI
jgi:4-hydroxy 2-oxovalerate aldolase